MRTRLQFRQIPDRFRKFSFGPRVAMNSKGKAKARANMKSSSPRSGTFPRALGNRSPRVMIVGDDEASEMYALYLGRNGFDVRTVRIPEEAHRIARSKREPVDLIVADFLVPEDALEMLQVLQADP